MNWEVIFWTCITLAVLMGTFATIMSIMSARGMKKRREKMLELYNGLAIGSKVLFANGLYGHVVGIGEETVSIEIAKGTIIKADRFSIQAIFK